MYSDGVLVVLGLAFVWLGVLSYFTWRQTRFLEGLFPNSGERDIRKKFEETISSVSEFRSNLKDLEGKLNRIDMDGSDHIQKLQLLRYNPYDDTGGDQSFSVALLDGSGDGLVVTSLHSRAGTRVFAKPVKVGKAQGYNFSEEEKKVIEKAIKS